MQTYIVSLSEHDPTEDQHGRLSMWRAFGALRTTQIALVFNIPLTDDFALPLNVWLSPVAYFTDNEVVEELYNVIKNIDAHRKFLQSVDRKMLVGAVFMMLIASVVCLKHEGFREEREWRAIYSPKRAPSRYIELSIEVVSGIPQLIYKVPLENNETAPIKNMEISELLDRLIIGPTQFPWVTYEAFVAALEAAGVKDAASRVFISRIPVRT